MNSKTKSKKVHPDDLENARWGYQVAISSSTLFAQQFWSIFNAMLVANSIVIAGISYVKSTQSLNPFSKYVSIIGLVLCLIWFLLSKRHQEFTAYYVLSARELEENPILLGGSLGDLTQ